jgi:hypothetical protein
MVDAENCRFIELSQKGLIEMSGGGQVVPERLLDDDPRLARAAAGLKFLSTVSNMLGGIAG